MKNKAIFSQIQYIMLFDYFQVYFVSYIPYISFSPFTQWRFNAIIIYNIHERMKENEFI